MPDTTRSQGRGAECRIAALAQCKASRREGIIASKFGTRRLDLVGSTTAGRFPSIDKSRLDARY
jgi:hypothetical protein